MNSNNSTIQKKTPIYLGLVHHPVVNKNGEEVTTSVTNFDLHDICRTATTYGIDEYFIITPSQAQQNLVTYMKGYWHEGSGATYNRDRKTAFECLSVSESIEQTCLTIKKRHATSPELIATTAKKSVNAISYKEYRLGTLQKTQTPQLILFGTGWGLAPSVMAKVDKVLEPILGPTAYNHLSVRAACAIILDRLFGSA